jgi:hypothetical protein
MPNVARKVTADRKITAETIRTKIGEVVIRRAAFEAVVKFNPTAQQTRFKKVPKPARMARNIKSRRETFQEGSCFKKKGKSAAVAIMVLAAEKARGEISCMAILAKG